MHIAGPAAKDYSAIGVNIVANELVATPEDTLGAKIARDFRVRKFLELAGPSDYEALGVMTSVEAANALDAAVGDSTSVFDTLLDDEA